jgi:hypothetical protein
MLDDSAPKIDFAADATIRVAYLRQVLTILRRINTACAFSVRDFVDSIRHMASSGCYSAARLKMLPRKPLLAIEGSQPPFVPPPDTMAHNGRYVVRNLHWAVGASSGSASVMGVVSGSPVGCFTGTSRGSTTMVLSGSPSCMCAPYLLPSVLA